MRSIITVRRLWKLNNADILVGALLDLEKIIKFRFNKDEFIQL